MAVSRVSKRIGRVMLSALKSKEGFQAKYQANQVFFLGMGGTKVHCGSREK
jgi:hypothetical protein